MRKLKKVISLAVITTLMNANMDMGMAFATEISERETIVSESASNVATLIPTVTSELADMVTISPTETEPTSIATISPTEPTSTVTVSPTKTETAESDFNIENGILVKYLGNGGDVVIPDGVKRIEDWAFGNCTSINSIYIPDSVTSIGNVAFCDCSNLNRIEFSSSITRIGQNVFLGTKWLDNKRAENPLVIVNNILVDGAKCRGDVVVPEGVTSICASAFWRGDISSIEIPSSVMNIPAKAFGECNNLVEVKLPSDLKSIGEQAFVSCAQLSSIDIPSGVTSIGKEAFSNCSKLNSVKLPSGGTCIGEQAFSNCSELSSIVFPCGLTSICKKAFFNCSKLGTIEIPNNVISIMEDAFSECGNLAISCDKGSVAEAYAMDDKSISCHYTSESDFMIEDGVLVDYLGTGGDVVIPEEVTKIGDFAFYNCNDLKSIELPEGVISIGKCAFDGCSNLNSIELPTGLKFIKQGAFRICSSLNSIELPVGLTSIGSEAFDSCSNLSSVQIPEGVTRIGRNAFRNCSSLSSVQLPDGILNVGYGVFSNCSNLSSIMLSKGMNDIGDEAFMNCTSLSSIEIPEGVTRIGKKAFSGCSILSNVELPDSLTSVEADAFESCQYVSDIDLPQKTNKVHEVYTEADLQQIMNYPSDTFKLMNDIAISESWDSIEEFSGVLDGGGCTISNVGTTLFWTLSKSSVVKNLNISGNINVTAWRQTGEFLAVYAYGTIENCTTKGVIQQKIGSMRQKKAGLNDLAGLVSVNYGIIRQCRNEVNIQQYVSGYLVAGIAASNYGTISDCENSGTIECGAACVGGIKAGDAYFEGFGTISYTRRNGQIINCINKGKIHSIYGGSGSVGGIAGDNKALIYNCINQREVSADCADVSVGGICGEASGYSYTIKCKNLGEIKSGICGKASIDIYGNDENGTFGPIPGNIIISDCLNIVSGIQEQGDGGSLIYNICGTAKSLNGEIRITRCKNIVAGEVRDAYYGKETVPINFRDKARIVAENNGDVDFFEATVGEAIAIEWGEEKDLGLLTEEGLSGILVDNPFIGYLENDGIFHSPGDISYAARIPDAETTGTAYYIYDDGSVVMHSIEAKKIVIVTATPTPTITGIVSTPDVPQTSIPTAITSPGATASVSPTATASPTATETAGPTASVSPTITVPLGPSITTTLSPSPVVSMKPTTTSKPVITKTPQKTQSIIAKNITKTYGDKAFHLGAKTTGNGKLTYTSSDKKVAVISASGKITIKGCGKTTITIKASETLGYKATQKKITITIKPKKQTISSLKSTKAKTITIEWKKDNKATGYILQYSTDRKFKKDVKTVTISNNKTTSKIIGKLKAGKKYYVRICAYKQSSGKIKGSYSGVKSVKVKK